MSVIKRSRSIIEFINYPMGKEKQALFKLPKNSEYLGLYFDKDGKIVEMVVDYSGKTGGIEMKTTHNFEETL